MTALFSAAWAGTVYIEDMNLGVMDRMLASPVRRGAMINGTVVYQGIDAVVQTAVIILDRVCRRGPVRATPRRHRPDLRGRVLLTVVFAAMSNAVALLSRDQNALIGISQLLSLPLVFLSSAIMDPDLAPAWMQTSRDYNPLDWAVVVSREGLSASTDWAAMWPRLGALAALAVVMSWLATQAFRAYQRSA